MRLGAWWRVAVAAAVLVAAAACNRNGGSSSPPSIRLTTLADGGTPVVEVVGLAPTTLAALRSATRTPEAWAAVFRVAIGPDVPAMLGSYDIAGDAVRFSPSFPLDPGRPYHARFDPTSIAGASAREQVIDATIALPAATPTPAAFVTRVYPTSDVVPENLLRLYIEFSAPMGRKSGVEHIRLLDHRGVEIPGAVLPLDYEFWSPDHTRFTVFFDPGRVKQGILPNVQQGRPLEVGRAVTLVVDRQWLDAHGQPLREEFRRQFTVGPAADRPLDPASWHIEPPAAGSRAAVVATFPGPLDHGLLRRALGVARDGTQVDGEIAIDTGEARWRFTPASAWKAGTYQLVALDILEDPAGNQIGRAFEVDLFERVDEDPNPASHTTPFVVR